MTASADVSSLAAAYDGITAVVAKLRDEDLLRPTRCRGWVVADLLCHLACDAQRALVTFATPVPGPSDVDHVSYWEGSLTRADQAARDRHAWWVRRTANAFESPAGIVQLWTETAPAVVRAAGAADPSGFLATQRHVLAVPDFVATRVTEAVVHHLDMLLDLPSAPSPADRAVDVAVSTMDGLLSDEVVRPRTWTDAEYLLKASGREPLTPRDRVLLGEAAGWFPLLG